MSQSWRRRDVLRTFVAATGMPALVSAATARPTVGIIGGGMAGVSLAWLLDGTRDVVVLESRDAIGGNIVGVEVELDGHAFTVDLGAQYFHPGPYPLYTALLAHLGLLTPQPDGSVGTHPFQASITVADPAEATPRFVSPIFWERTWPLLPSWNLGGLAAFGLGFQAAKTREQQNESWGLTLGDWLPTLGLTQAQWEGMLLPWAASIFSGSIEQARGLSARAAMIFAAKALPDNPLDPLLYYALRQGMTDVLRRLLDQCSTVQVLTGARVQQVSRNPTGGFTIACADGRVVVVDEMVFASSGPGTLELLDQLPGTAAQRGALGGIEFHEAQLALHTDPIYAHPDPRIWSFLNCEVRGAHCEASMWMGGVLADVPAATAARVWKSWVTHRAVQPAEILHEASFKHMLPTPATLFAQAVLRVLQGRDGLWFAGGYTLPYDSQETALLSAIGVAIGLNIASPRLRNILAASPQSRKLLSAD